MSSVSPAPEYFEVDIDSRVLGLNSHVIFGCPIEPARLKEAGTRWPGTPRSRSPPPPPGRPIWSPSPSSATRSINYEYLTGGLASLPGMRSVETAPIIRTLKRTGSVH